MKARGSMLLDRGLTFELLEVAFRIATSDQPWEQQRRLLTVALRDHVSAQEAEGKTKKCLTRIWVNPPPEAAPMIAWVTRHAYVADDRRVLHLGAILGTFPFAGTVAAVIGRALALEGEVNASDVRRRVRGVWGDKASVDVAARKVYTTFKSLGVLAGGGRGPLVAAPRLPVPGPIALWVVHSLLLTRQAQAVADSDVDGAPELFWAALGQRSNGYPLVSRHTEGRGRTVWSGWDVR